MNRARARQFLLFASLSCVLLLTLVGMINFAIDPLQFFRQARFTDAHFSTNQRYQNPGLARNFPYDTVVIGTSHMENFSPALVRQALGGEPLKLAISGASVREQALMLELALRNPRLKRVVWGVLADSFDYSDSVVSDYGPFPWHLYHADFGLLSQYLWSFDTLKSSALALSTPSSQPLESLNTWSDQGSYGPDQVEAAWLAMGARWDERLYAFYSKRVPAWEDAKFVATRRMVAPIRAHPTVRFDLVFPPYSILEYANDFRVHRERFARRVLLKDYLIKQLAGLPNVAIHDFETDPLLNTDLSRFKDLSHSSLATTELILHDIAAGTRTPRDPARALTEQLVQFLDQRCAADEPTRCSARMRCGRDQLRRWLEAGANPQTLLRYSNLDICR